MIRSDTKSLEKEIKHLETVFCDINEYPTNVVKTVIEEEKRRQQQQTHSTTVSIPDDNTGRMRKIPGIRSQNSILF